MRTLNLNVLGVGIIVNTSSEEFLDFVECNFSKYLAVRDSCRAKILVEFSPDAASVARRSRINMVYEGNDVYSDGASLVWANEYGFICKVRTVLRAFVVHAWHHAMDDTVSWEDCQRCMRWCIQYPLFIALQRFNVGVAHAAGVLVGNKGVVLAGLGGVGKSTLAVKLGGYENVLSDNYLLGDDEFLYPAPEALRLDPRSIALLGGIDVSEKFFLYGKSQYCVGFNRKLMPSIGFLLRRSLEANLSEVSTRNAASRLQAMRQFSPEFPEKSFFSMLPAIQEDSPSTVTPDCLKRIDWYELTVGNLDATAELVYKLLGDN